MPKTQTLTPDQLREQAATLAAQAADAQAELDRLDEQQRAREWEAQLDRDRQTVDAYSRAALDQEVDKARAAFDQAVEDLPIVQAMAAYLAAQYRRSWAYADAMAARDRLGLPSGATQPDSAFVPPLAESITRAAERLGQAQIDAERGQA